MGGDGRRVLDVAARCDARALYAGLQAAQLALLELAAETRSLDRLPNLEAKILRALDVGDTYGSPAHLVSLALPDEVSLARHLRVLCSLLDAGNVSGEAPGMNERHPTLTPGAAPRTPAHQQSAKSGVAMNVSPTPPDGKEEAAQLMSADRPVGFSTNQHLAVPADAYNPDGLASLVVAGARYQEEWVINICYGPGHSPQVIGSVRVERTTDPDVAADTAKAWLDQECEQLDLKVVQHVNHNDKHGPAERPYFTVAQAVVADKDWALTGG